MSGDEEAGRVEILLTAAEGGAPMRAVPTLDLRPGTGVVGDRYALGTGYWSGDRYDDVTLVEGETGEAVERELGRPVSPELLRRNVVTRGVGLDGLTGRRFRVGEVVLEGLRPCHPCRYLEMLTGLDGLKEALRGRGGLRARVVQGGRIGVGDRVLLME